MRKIWLVVKREYLTRVRTKGFILSTVGFPLFSIGIFAFVIAMATSKSDQPIKISIVDNLGGIGAARRSLVERKTAERTAALPTDPRLGTARFPGRR